MKTWLARRVCVPLLLGLVMPLFFVQLAEAQQQFFTQSGGRGLQNAKTNARLSKTEGDVDALNVQMAKVKPHAMADLGSCPDGGDKLRWTGTNWVCEQETDPTVQPFAKKSLPNCASGTQLSVVAGNFSCVDAGFLSNEADPTVQAFAKSPLPTCGSDQVLTTSGGALSCMSDQRGLSREADPMVHDFARVDVVPTLPNCAANEVLTMNAGRLKCQVDALGSTLEADPKVADFARNDISGYTLAACASGEALRAVTENGKVLLKCESISGNVQEVLSLGELVDVDTTGQTSGTVLMYDGVKWTPKAELDPTVPDWAKSNLTSCASGQVLTYISSTIQCIDDAGGANQPVTFAGLSDVNVTGVTDGKFVKYDGTSSKWIPGTVADFAQTDLPTCFSGQVLTSDGDTFSCVSGGAGGGGATSLYLTELEDVKTGPNTTLVPQNNQFLRWNSTTSKWQAVHDKLTGTLTNGKWCYYNGTDVVCDRGAPAQCGTGDVISWNNSTSSFDCVSGTTALGLGTMAYQNANNVAITGGAINGTPIGMTTPSAGRFTNLWVTGNFYVSGTQSIDGVSFLNGGVQATGAVTATTYYGDGSHLTNLSTANMTVPGAPGDVQIKGVDGTISATARLNWDDSKRNLGVSGTVQVAGSGAEVCDTQAKGTMRVVDVGAGDFRMQFCRP